MAKRNGFFRLKIEPNSVSLQLIPPVDGGAKIETAEVLEYLNTVKVHNYDLKIVDQGIKQLQDKPVMFKISEESISKVPEMSKVRISNDRMVATIRLYPPSNDGALFSKGDLVGELTHAGIKYGVVDKVVDALIATPVFGHDIVIAKGKPVREGADARIEYNFETNPLAKPKLNEDGSVDFHQLNIFTSVEKDQLLATLIPEDPGEQGIDVMNNPVLPHKVSKKVLKCGKNIRFSEDRLKIYSEVNGDVKLEGDTVFVSNTYTVPADVDTSTGDINYDGNVVVTGNVRTGFKVKASGDIQIKGVVEGAEIVAGGNIVLARGIQGMSRGVLEAEGDIVTKFIESAIVKAKGVVRSGSILHSTIESGDTIVCEGKKSYVVGGSLSAKNLIDVKTLGNEMGTVTNVKIGVDASVLQELHTMQQEFEDNKEEIEKCVQVLVLFKKRVASGQKLTPDKIALVKTANDEKTKLEERQTELKELIAGAKQEIEANTRGRLRVSNLVYPGVRIMMSNNQYIVKDVMKYCQFRIRSGEVIAEGL